MPPFWKTLKFWMAFATVGYLVAKHYFPDLPFLTEEWFQGLVLGLLAPPLVSRLVHRVALRRVPGFSHSA